MTECVFEDEPAAEVYLKDLFVNSLDVLARGGVDFESVTLVDMQGNMNGESGLHGGRFGCSFSRFHRTKKKKCFTPSGDL